MTPSHYAQLQVWQLAMELAEDIYRFNRTLPSEQRFGLSSQLQKAGVSVPSNIAEGNVRDTTRDYARFVSMARGSVAEIGTQLILASRIGMGDPKQLAGCKSKSQRVGSMLVRLHAALKQKASLASRGTRPESGVPSRQSPVPSPESR